MSVVWFSHFVLRDTDAVDGYLLTGYKVHYLHEVHGWVVFIWHSGLFALKLNHHKSA